MDSKLPKASAYYLYHLHNDISFLATEYINDEWYYLNWNSGKYYTEPLLLIKTPISLSLGTADALSVYAMLLLWEPESTSSVSNSVKQKGNLSKDKDEPVLAQD